MDKDTYLKDEAYEMRVYIEIIKRVSKTVKDVFGNENFATKHFGKELAMVDEIYSKSKIISESLKKNLSTSSDSFENDEYLKRVWMTTY